MLPPMLTLLAAAVAAASPVDGLDASTRSSTRSTGPAPAPRAVDAGGATAASIAERAAQARLRGDRAAWAARRRRRAAQRQGADGAGPHRPGRPAGGREDGPALRQQGRRRRTPRARGRRDARLRPRHAHDLPGRHRRAAGRAQGPLGGHGRADRPAGRGDGRQGARAMLDDGLYHALPQARLRPGPARQRRPGGRARSATSPATAMASVDSVDVTIRGKGGHGADAAHDGRPDRAGGAHRSSTCRRSSAARSTRSSPAVVTVGSIHGGTKHNIIPDEVKLQLTVRSYKPEVRKQCSTASSASPRPRPSAAQRPRRAGDEVSARRRPRPTTIPA